MNTRKLGYSDLQLTPVGLGTWAIGGPWQYGWGPQDDQQSIKTILQAMDQGINWIDTAPIYGCGHSERIVGQALKQMSQKPIVATKCGLRWNDQREKVNNLNKDSIIRECEESLERLGIEVIDLYQMHWNIPDEQIEEGYEAMALCQQQGKVRYIGVSNYTRSQLERVSAMSPLASVQPPYSMLRQEAEQQLFEYCRNHEVGIVCYSPLQKGLLTGKFDKDYLDTLASDDHRRNDPRFQEPLFSGIIKFVNQLKPIAARNNLTLSQLAIAWVLRKPEVTSAIVGARTPQQIMETAAAGDCNLCKEDCDEIETLLKELEGKNG